jgi:hypothetical protein
MEGIYMNVVDILDKFSIDGSTALITLLVIVLLAIIGYYADKTKFAKEKVDTKKKKKIQVADKGINDVVANNEESNTELTFDGGEEVQEEVVQEEVFTPLEEEQINNEIEESVKASISEVEEEMNAPQEEMTFDEEQPQPEMTFDEEQPQSEMTFDEEQPQPEMTFDEEQPQPEMTFDSESTTEEVPEEVHEEPVSVEVQEPVAAEPVQEDVQVEQSAEEVEAQPEMTFDSEPVVQEEQPVEVSAEEEHEEVPPTIPFETTEEETSSQDLFVSEEPREEVESVPEELFAPIESVQPATTVSTNEVHEEVEELNTETNEEKKDILDDDFGINDLPTLKVNKETNDNLAVDDIFKI